MPLIYARVKTRPDGNKCRTMKRNEKKDMTKMFTKTMNEGMRMMRTMLPSILIVLTAGWFAACSSDSDEYTQADKPVTPADTSTVISFGGSMDNGTQTRATRPLHETHSEFRLMGYKNTDDELSAPEGIQTVFHRYQMLYDAALIGTTTDNTSGWYYAGIMNEGVEQTIKYWDFSAGGYRFFAAAPSGLDNPVTEGGYTVARTLQVNVDGQNEDNRSVAAKDKTTPYISKLWMKKRNEYIGGGYNNAVQLEFYKPLARVRFILLDEQGNALTSASEVTRFIDESTIRFAPTNTTERIVWGGIAVVRYPLTGTAGESITYTPDVAQVYEALTVPYESQTDETEYAFVNSANKERWYHVLPRRTTQGSFTLSFEYNGALRTATVPAEYLRWDTSYAYTYAFKVSPTSVNFDMKLSTFVRWQAGYTETTEW